MKKQTKLSVAALCIAAAILAAYLAGYAAVGKMKNQRYKGASDSPSPLFTVTAHTGCEGTKDNSLEAIAAGYEAGANIVEFDLNFNEKNEPVLSHDEATGDETTLESAFKELSKHSGLKANVDVKTASNMPAVMSLAEKYDVARSIFFTGVEEEKVQAVKDGCPGIPYYLNLDVKTARLHTKAYALSLAEKVKSCGAVGINLNHKGLSKELVEAFRENGLLVSVWTVSKDTEMFRALYYAPDNITTRNPKRLIELINKLG